MKYIEHNGNIVKYTTIEIALELYKEQIVEFTNNGWNIACVCENNVILYKLDI